MGIHICTHIFEGMCTHIHTVRLVWAMRPGTKDGGLRTVSFVNILPLSLEVMNLFEGLKNNNQKEKKNKKRQRRQEIPPKTV